MADEQEDGMDDGPAAKWAALQQAALSTFEKGSATLDTNAGLSTPCAVSWPSSAA